MKRTTFEKLSREGLLPYRMINGRRYYFGAVLEAFFSIQRKIVAEREACK